MTTAPSDQLPDTGFTADPSLAELSKYITDNRTVPFMDTDHKAGS